MNIDSKVIDAFHLMWENFPEPAMLVHKNRDILAVNECFSKLGVVVGRKCTSIGAPEEHNGCLANQALASGRAAYSKSESNGKTVIGFWIPVADHPDIYVHFYIGTTIDYDKC